VGESPETADDALKAVQFLYALGADLRGATDFKDPRSQPQAQAQGQGQGQGQGGGFGRGAGLDGAGALHGAVGREAPELVKWLVEHGAPLDLKNKGGQTALDTVYRFGLSTTRTVRDVIGEILRDAMVAKGLPVPQRQGTAASN